VRSLLQRFEAFALRPGFGDGVLLALCATIVVLAAVMQPSTETLTLFGWDVPVMCTLRRLTGLSCPGCGLTRSFVFLAHGQIVEAFRMNVFGPFAFAWVLGQLPWRALRIWRANR
jgi:hypothetical protein